MALLFINLAEWHISSGIWSISDTMPTPRCRSVIALDLDAIGWPAALGRRQDAPQW